MRTPSSAADAAGPLLRPVHAARVELDDAVGVRQAAVADARVLGIELDDVDARDQGVEHVGPPPVIIANAFSTHVTGPPFLNRLPLADETTTGLDAARGDHGRRLAERSLGAGRGDGRGRAGPDEITTVDPSGAHGILALRAAASGRECQTRIGRPRRQTVRLTGGRSVLTASCDRGRSAQPGTPVSPADRPPGAAHAPMNMDRYAGASLRSPDASAACPELATDLWWSWHYRRAGRCSAGSTTRSGGRPPTTRCGCCGCCRRERLERGGRRPGVPRALRRAHRSGSTPRARRRTPGGRARYGDQPRPTHRLLLGRVRAAPVAADLRRRPRRAGRRPLQGGQRPRAAARRRRASCTRRATSTSSVSADGWQEETLRAARLGGRARSSRPRRPDGSRCVIAVPLGDRTVLRAGVARAARARRALPARHGPARRTRRGTASCRRASTAATRRRASSRRSSSGIGGVRALRALGIDAGRLAPERGPRGVRRAAAHPRAARAAASASTTRSRRSAGSTVFTTHTPVPAGHDAFPFHLVEKHLAGRWGTLGEHRDRFLALGRVRQRRRHAVQHDGARHAHRRRGQRRQPAARRR